MKVTVQRSGLVIAFIALVWLINGLFCKLLNFVPRHQLIVANILGSEHAGVITKMIGGLEVLMVVWIISGISPKFCAAAQIVIIAAMNIIEFVLVPDLLLFGKWNLVFALMLILTIFFNAFKSTSRCSSANS